MIFLMPIYFIIALVVIYKLMKKYQGQHKWRRFLLLAFLFYLPVGWDVILGRSYFQYLCHKDGGIHIYQTVELGPEYWNEDGRPRFYTEDKGAFDSSVFGGRYKENRVSGEKFSKFLLNGKRYVYQIIDITTGQALGEWVRYFYYGGWVMNTGTPFGGVGFSCPLSSEIPDNTAVKGTTNGDYRKFTSYIFLRKETNEGRKK